MNISIVIPVYNEAVYIGSCLDAIKRQTVMPHEVIVVDNNSTDDTSKIVRRYSFVKLIHESRQGIVHARNLGFDSVSADIIGRIDADSILAPDWIEIVLKSFAANKSIAAITGRAAFYDVRMGKTAGTVQVFIYQYLQKLISGTFTLWGSTMAMRQTSWKSVKNDCSVRSDVDEDIDLSLKLHAHKLHILFMPNLIIGASLRRGVHNPIAIAKYLNTWPKDYTINKHYVAAAFITLLCIIIVILSLPLSLINRVLPAAIAD